MNELRKLWNEIGNGRVVVTKYIFYSIHIGEMEKVIVEYISKLWKVRFVVVWLSLISILNAN